MEDRRRETRELLSEIGRARFPRGVECPRCSASDIRPWGHFSGRRRYRCKSCLRTFSDLTATPVAYLKKVELLRPYVVCLRHSLSVRVAAKTVGIAPSTAFRWRHRLLRELDRHHAETLSGTVELTASRVRESCKGQRNLARPARHHGPTLGRFLEIPKTAIAIAVDRHANVVTASVPYLPIRTLDLEQWVGPRCRAVLTVVAAEGRLGRAATFAKRIGASFCDARRPRESEISGARDYGERLNAWLERFRGVATKYLANYLGWHRILTYDERHPLECVGRPHLERAVLSWPLAHRNNSRAQSATGAEEERAGVGGGGGRPKNANAPAGSKTDGGVHHQAGGDVLSHRVASAVPSAQEGLTAVFGMGTGVTPPLSHQPMQDRVRVAR
jgi:transposase-like protein